LLELIRPSPRWGFVRRVVSLLTSWPGADVEEKSPAQQRRLAGLVNLDLYTLTREEDNLIESLTTEVERAGVHFSDWGEQECLEFRAAVWRSAHRFLLANASLIDRSPEAAELLKILRIK
jgi:hypothetical protein